MKLELIKVHIEDDTHDTFLTGARMLYSMTESYFNFSRAAQMFMFMF